MTLQEAVDIYLKCLKEYGHNCDTCVLNYKQRIEGKPLCAILDEANESAKEMKNG